MGGTRRDFLKGATTATLLGSALVGSAQAQTAPKKFNILFVFTDQERFHERWPKDMSLPGHDRMQATGVRFTNHQCPATMCTVPSRSW